MSSIQETAQAVKTYSRSKGGVQWVLPCTYLRGVSWVGQLGGDVQCKPGQHVHLLVSNLHLRAAMQHTSATHRVTLNHQQCSQQYKMPGEMNTYLVGGP